MLGLTMTALTMLVVDGVRRVREDYNLLWSWDAGELAPDPSEELEFDIDVLPPRRSAEEEHFFNPIAV